MNEERRERGREEGREGEGKTEHTHSGQMYLEFWVPQIRNIWFEES